VPRIEAVVGKYDHFRPARHLLGNPDLADNIDALTLDRFEELFDQVNPLLS
jgi:hypothetical protein